MIHYHVEVYNERSGDPKRDNQARRMNRALNRACRTHFRVQTPRGRRRKHVLTRVEYANYCRLVAVMAEETRRA